MPAKFNIAMTFCATVHAVTQLGRIGPAGHRERLRLTLKPGSLAGASGPILAESDVTLSAPSGTFVDGESVILVLTAQRALPPKAAAKPLGFFRRLLNLRS
jgi:hypothetical protein